ncbi:hypothetical protein DL762_005704 [Monosporascus cannonballus]|uniref:Heterokaryon incompatibility domain-containing protein n=1 Tax=Monosporascus cannonballus TaxID=155416 RepID=A0ABY0H447_9PEZI|nr:hypothetical protein DL762_005704 [Monosporascus cannonballus]
MRLINNESMELEYFMGGSNVPDYAILSHTWEDGEVTFQEFTHRDKAVRPEKRGYQKIEKACVLAREIRLKYVWVDTCCIDKTSSAELTEAINSMFQWYKDAVVCYAWLSDLPEEQLAPPESFESCFMKCRWFTRGWTLQELIAPKCVEFYDQTWNFRGTKADLSDFITQVTEISGEALRDPERLYRFSVAQRMSWAATRQTTRIEDMAYCLLGIFDVNMPLLYGEGSRAFIRLQEEIAKETNDLSLFAWKTTSTDQMYHGVFASSPAEFRDSGSITPVSSTAFNPDFTITNKGLRLTNSLHPGQDGTYLLDLNCSQPTGSRRRQIGIWIKPHGGGVYGRAKADEFGTVDPEGVGKSTRVFLLRRINAARSADLESSHSHAFMFRKGFNERDAIHEPGFLFEATFMQPMGEWDPQRRMFLTHGASNFVGFGFFSQRSDITIGKELMGGESFLIVFGKNARDGEPWVTIASPRDGGELFHCMNDLQKMAALASNRNKRVVVMKDDDNKDRKAVSVAIENAMIAGQVVYCIDMSYHDAAIANSRDTQGVKSNTLSRRKGKASKHGNSGTESWLHEWKDLECGYLST